MGNLRISEMRVPVGTPAGRERQIEPGICRPPEPGSKTDWGPIPRAHAALPPGAKNIPPAMRGLSGRFPWAYETVTKPSKKPYRGNPSYLQSAAAKERSALWTAYSAAAPCAALTECRRFVCGSEWVLTLRLRLCCRIDRLRRSRDRPRERSLRVSVPCGFPSWKP